MILCEFDSNKEAIINPWILCKSIEVKGEMPKIVVGCFEGKMFNRLVKLLDGELMDAIEKYYTLTAEKQKMVRDLIRSLSE